jgi:hypothetical protein
MAFRRTVLVDETGGSIGRLPSTPAETQKGRPPAFAPRTNRFRRRRWAAAQVFRPMAIRAGARSRRTRRSSPRATREPIAQPRKISLAQPRRAPVQQAQELAACNTIRKTKESYLGFVNLVSVLQWIPFPRNLNLSDDFNRFSENSSKMAE